MRIEEALEVIGADPAATGCFCDFDGTLARIVEDPADARPVPGAVDVLSALASRFAIVGIVSGRSRDDLVSRCAPAGVVLAGSYGRERGKDTRMRPENVDGAADAVAAEAAGLDGVVVERKVEGVALHYRKAPVLAEDVRAVAVSVAGRFGLEVRPGRLVYELVPPGPGKGDAMAELAREHAVRTALVAGDDAADLEGVRIMRAGDVRTVFVAVASAEAPDDLVDEADVVVSDPDELVALLRRLV